MSLCVFEGGSQYITLPQPSGLICNLITLYFCRQVALFVLFISKGGLGSVVDNILASRC